METSFLLELKPTLILFLGIGEIYNDKIMAEQKKTFWDFLNGDIPVLVDFYATWCGPCKISMPQMSNLQAKYASEAIFVGVTDESPEQVEVFLASESRPGSTWSDEIQYRLATDREQSMSRNYMAAANQMNIPTAFIVGKTGKIEWMGHPAMIEKPLAKATAAVTTPPAK